MDSADSGTPIIVQNLRPDGLFPAESQERLADLMERWRNARGAGSTLNAEEQAELEALVDSEMLAATRRVALLLSPA